jgi:hypothetical protein
MHSRMDWIDLNQDKDPCMAHVNTVMNIRVPYNSGIILSLCTTGSFLKASPPCSYTNFKMITNPTKHYVHVNNK